MKALYKLAAIFAMASAISEKTIAQKEILVNRPRAAWRNRGQPYPESSSRQAAHRYRRAQGGPGIVLNPTTLQYEPRKEN